MCPNGFPSVTICNGTYSQGRNGIQNYSLNPLLNQELTHKLPLYDTSCTKKIEGEDREEDRGRR